MQPVSCGTGKPRKAGAQGGNMTTGGYRYPDRRSLLVNLLYAMLVLRGPSRKET